MKELLTEQENHLVNEIFQQLENLPNLNNVTVVLEREARHLMLQEIQVSYPMITVVQADIKENTRYKIEIAR